MRLQEIHSEISRLALSEKLLLVEDIWDSIAAGNTEIPMPQWQRQALDERYGQYKAGKLALHDWEDIHKDLREKYR